MKKNQNRNASKAQDDDLVDSSYLYQGLQKTKDEVLQLKKLLDDFSQEDFAKLPKYSQTALNDISVVIQKMLKPYDPEGALFKLETQEGIEELWNSVSEQCQGKSNEELVQMIFNQTALASISQYLANCFADQLAILNTYFFNTSYKNFKNNSKRQVGKKGVFSSNKACLTECYEEFLRSLDRAITNTDYLSFQKFVRKKYPQPPFIPKPRLTSDEKQMPLEVQAKDRIVKKRSDWVESTIRKAFYEFSGLKGTTKKK